jgi:hypothetical protein
MRWLIRDRTDGTDFRLSSEFPPCPATYVAHLDSFGEDTLYTLCRDLTIFGSTHRRFLFPVLGDENALTDGHPGCHIILILGVP